ncbi:MAG: hypothetical protein K0B02_00050 [DPANN group archaeon]|nr:hypothetical protein [DPANN group archaeon]
MVLEKKIDQFIKSQTSIQFYFNVQKALKDVLSSMNASEYKECTYNLYLLVLHKEALGQVMHFPNPKGRFKVMQLTIPKDISEIELKYVIAHEFGHVLQGRNWEHDDADKLEVDADKFAARLGYKRPESWSKRPKTYKKTVKIM